MKKLIVLVSATLFLGISSCGEAPHVHSFSKDYTYDGTGHWHAATCEHIDEIDGFEVHDFTSWRIISETLEERNCKVCDYVETQPHVHGVDTSVYEHNEEYHWHPSTCGHSSAISYEPHSYVDEIITPVSFEADGKTRHTCSECGYSYIETIPQLEHTYASIYSYDENYHYYACTDAGYEDLRDQEEAHQYGNWSIVNEDEEERYCSICHYRQVKAHVHSFDESRYESDENYHWHPSTCGHDDTVNKINHSFGEWKIVSFSKEERECNVCHYIEEKEHTHSYNLDEYVYNETEHWHADKCGHNTRIDVEEHQFGEWSLASSGLDERKCTNCEYVETRAHQHTFSNEWSSNAYIHWHASTCGHETTSGRADHSWGETVVITPATEYETGLGEHTCSVCGYKTTVVIPALPHTHTFDTEHWEANGSTHWHAPLCLHTDLKDSEAKHTWGEWSLAPEGHYQRSCTVCGYIQNKTSDYSPIYNPDNKTITFGEYPQSSVLDADLRATLDGLTTTDSKGYYSYNGEKYQKGSYGGSWYKVEPLSWTVLREEANDKTLVFADLSFYKLKYNDKNTQTYLGDKFYSYYQSYVYEWLAKGFINDIIKPFDSLLSYVNIDEDGDVRQARAWIPSLDELDYFGYKGSSKLINYCTNYAYSEGFFTRTYTKSYSSYYLNVVKSNGVVEGVNFTSTYGIRPMIYVNVHKYSQTYTYDSTYHWHDSICSHEDLTTTKVKHQLTNWVTTLEPTEEDDGVEERHCKYCEYHETRAIPALIFSKFNFKLNSEGTGYSVTTYLNEEEVTIPATFRGLPVVELGDYCFKTKNKIIHLPDTITKIDDYVFSNTSITEFTIPSTITEFSGTSCFQNCTQLEKLTIEIPLDTLPYRFLSGCSNLTELNLASPYTKMGAECFAGCAKYIKGDYVVPEEVEDVSSGCYMNCTDLTSIDFKGHIKGLYGSLFKNCTSLKEIKGLDNVHLNVGQSCFENCTALETFTVPKNTMQILYHAFYNASNLKTLYIGSDLFGINNNAFDGCTSMSVIVDEANTNFASENGVLYNSYKSDLIFMPNSLLVGNVDFLPESLSRISTTFENSKLVSITFPSKITSIGSNMFKNCSLLETVNFNEAITSIGASAFENCNSLTSMTLPDTIESVASGAFTSCANLTEFYVGSGIKSIYSDSVKNCSKYIQTGDGTFKYYGSTTNRYEVVSSILPGVTLKGGLTIRDDTHKMTVGLFKNKTGLTSIDSFGGLKSISKEGFYSCIFTSINIPGTVEHIGEYAFRYCSRLTEFTLNEGITTLDGNFLDNCSKLATVNLCKSVTKVGMIASSVSALKTINYPGTVSEYNKSAYKKVSVLFHKSSVGTTVVTCSDGTVNLF